MKRTQQAGLRGGGGPPAGTWAALAALAALPTRRGGCIRVRQASPADHGGLRAFLAGLSTRTRYLRFFTGAPLTSPAMLRVLAGDGQGVDAVVATLDGVIVGHAMAAYATGPGGTLAADIGVVVADEWQGRGVGAWLIRTLTARARARGATILVMDVLAENRKVLAMIARRWPDAPHDRSAAEVTVRARLAPQQGGTAHGRLTRYTAAPGGSQSDGRAGGRRDAPRKPAAVIPVG